MNTRAAFNPRIFARSSSLRFPIVRSIAAAECGQVFQVPALFVALEQIGRVGSETLEAVMKQLHQRPTVHRGQPESVKRGKRLANRRVLPVALVGQFPSRIERNDRSPEAATHTTMEVPVELVPVFREMIAKRRAD